MRGARNPMAGSWHEASPRLICRINLLDLVPGQRDAANRYFLGEACHVCTLGICHAKLVK
jgi:hypothetical protein